MIVNFLINRPRTFKQLILALLDSFVALFSIFISFSLRLGEWYWPDDSQLVLAILLSPILLVTIFYLGRLYSSIVRYISINSLRMLLYATSLYSALWGLFVTLYVNNGFPKSVILLNWILVSLCVIFSRYFAKKILITSERNDIELKKFIVFGTGKNARSLLNFLVGTGEYKPLAFIDNSSEFINRVINGVKVVSENKLENLKFINPNLEAFIAFDKSSKKSINEIFDKTSSLNIKTRVLPNVYDLFNNSISFKDIKEISVNDLLGRESIKPIPELLRANISDKVVMVTGGGGSIGSELCRQIFRNGAKKLIILERSELALYQIDQELKDQNVIPVLGSVNDVKRLDLIIRKYSVESIYHAAAFKHVPIVENNLTEGIKNNIFGTLNIVSVAIKNNIKNFVLISTDKAVRPTNIMGATKRVAEIIVQSLAYDKNMSNYSIVRFGNVLDSSGSVIPLFRKQIANGGPVTVTHKDIERFFMTIDEAVELVIQAGAMKVKSNIFVLDMGQPVKITDLAKKMIELSGNHSNQKKFDKISIEYVGLRPGEKLSEELVIGSQIFNTQHPKIIAIKEEFISWAILDSMLKNLDKIISKGSNDGIIEVMRTIVPEYNPSNSLRNL